MSAKRLIVESAVKDALKEASGLQVISAEAVEWVNKKTALLIGACAGIGRRTTGGRLMAPLIDPDGSNARPTVTIGQTAEPRADGRARPERLCPRAKEFAALSPEQQAEHLHKLYVMAPAINEEAISILNEICECCTIGTALYEQAQAIITSAKDLQP